MKALYSNWHTPTTLISATTCMEQSFFTGGCLLLRQRNYLDTGNSFPIPKNLYRVTFIVFTFLQHISYNKAIPLQTLTNPQGSSRLRLLEFPNNRHMKVVRLSAISTGRLYPKERFLVFISVRGWVHAMAIVGPEGLSHWKIPVTPSGMEPTTFRLIVQCHISFNTHFNIIFISKASCLLITFLNAQLMWAFY
jgi:hypothetical protein